MNSQPTVDEEDGTTRRTGADAIKTDGELLYPENRLPFPNNEISVEDQMQAAVEDADTSRMSPDLLANMANKSMPELNHPAINIDEVYNEGVEAQE